VLDLPKSIRRKAFAWRRHRETAIASLCPLVVVVNWKGIQMQQFSALFQRGNIGALELKNRIIMSGMGGKATTLADPEGNVTDRLVQYYRARARGDVGMIVTQSVLVTADEKPPYDLTLHDDAFVPGFRMLAEAVHEEGGRLCIQLMNYGLLMLLMGMMRPPDMPIRVPTITAWMTDGKPYEEIGEDQIQRYLKDFAAAAGRAKEAGADAVELHACHGCQVATFLSPATNHRTDEYGGSPENRARFACMIVQEMRKEVGPDFPISIRINGDDDIEGGTSVEEAVTQAVLLEGAGASAISVSGGWEYWSPSTIACYAFPKGLFVSLAAEVKKSVGVPVITAGKITPELGERILLDGKADYIAMGRPFLADPEIVRKLREGRIDEIRQCIYCNNCLGSGRGGCSVNPFLYRESRPLAPTEAPKKVMVVGGGIAGMHTSVLLAQKGHKVTLYEKESKLGGQWNIVAAMPGKEDYASLMSYLIRSLENYKVPIVLSKAISKDDVADIRPDVVVVATGATPRWLGVPGGKGENVVQAVDVIEGTAIPKGKVAVIGGRFIGMEVAIMLAEQAREVCLITKAALGENGLPVEPFTFKALVRRLIELNIPLYLNSAVLEITERSVVFRLGEDVLTLPADTVVLAVGAESENALIADIEGVVSEVVSVGDCVEPHDAAEAAYSAHRVAMRL